MKYFIAIIIILLIILACMGCATVKKQTNVFVIDPVIVLEIEQ